MKKVVGLLFLLVLFFSTSAYGQNRLGIELIESPTAKAKDIFNELVTRKKTGGCFHLTC